LKLPIGVEIANRKFFLKGKR